MTLAEKIQKLIFDIETLDTEMPEQKLPQNVYYLNDQDIVCLERKHGESRYPLSADGLVVWARSSGYIEAYESTFHIFKPIYASDDPSVNFFAGIPLENGGFFPVSLFEINKPLFEPLPISRYVVYSTCCAYYIAKEKGHIFAVRLHVDAHKHIHFSFVAVNMTDKPFQFYMASEIEAILRFAESENFWEKLEKTGRRGKDTCLLQCNEDCLAINMAEQGGRRLAEYHSAGRMDMLGGSGRKLSNAESLRSGRLAGMRLAVSTTDVPAAVDMIHVELAPGESVRREYDLSYCHSLSQAEKALGAGIDTRQIDKALENREKHELEQLSCLDITFGDWKGSVSVKVLNRFIKSVQKQVNFCALGKNYAGSFIGIRDVMQQLEGSLIWEPAQSRQKILTAMQYILEDGRPPRQFSLPASADALPEMDLRMFIDQGNWIVSTLYTYLAFTDDYSILSEPCGYYIPNKENTRIVAKSRIVDTVLDHLLKIMDFLACNLDSEGGTGCLRALYGDWNDSINELGGTRDPGKLFGSGVSVMATLHFYQNCKEMAAILKKIGLHKEKAAGYSRYRRQIEAGLFQYAIDRNAAQERRVVHGWGDKLSYKIGSWRDPDNRARISSTSHAFWVLSGMIHTDVTMRESILKAFEQLDSKYGLRTFDVPFPPSMRPLVGRICTTTPGTYENGTAYVHASLFAVMALFALGEGGLAWKQMEKSMVISHSNCTMTPFVMPNSYCYNPAYGIDGESMGDWYTGSGTVLIKGLIKHGFGIVPDLDGLTIQMPREMPCDHAELRIVVKGHG